MGLSTCSSYIGFRMQGLGPPCSQVRVGNQGGNKPENEQFWDAPAELCNQPAPLLAEITEPRKYEKKTAYCWLFL